MTERTSSGSVTEQGAGDRRPEARRRPAGAEQAGKQQRTGSFLAELPVLVVVAFVLALLLKTFLVQAFYIPSESMLPTLAVGDRVLVNKIVYDLRDPWRGEVVVFSQEPPQGAPQQSLLERTLSAITSGLGFTAPAERDFIKRIVGLPGEEIAVREGTLYVDGRPVRETVTANGGYLAEPDLTEFGPVRVPPGHYFMMGDNRLNSSDSRTVLGAIEREEIVGRAFVVIWPPDRIGLLSRPDYGLGPDAATVGGQRP